jgi:OmpA family
MTKIFISTFLLLASTIFSQTKGRLTNKTLKDSVFVKGDIIKIPELLYSLSHPMNPTVNDSLVPVADFLKKYPTLKVEISSHADSRGSANGNLQLSKFRAEHVWNYLIKGKGIDSTRLYYKGYGATLLIIPDTEILKVKAREEKEKLHKINRRTELKVIDLK